MLQSAMTVMYQCDIRKGSTELVQGEDCRESSELPASCCDPEAYSTQHVGQRSSGEITEALGVWREPLVIS